MNRTIALLALTLLAASAQAYVLQPDASGADQRIAGPMSYAVSQAGSRDLSYDQIVPAVDAAFAAWQAASNGKLAFQDVGPTSLGPPSAGETRLGVPIVVSFERAQWSFEGDDQAVTILEEDPDSHEILRADIVVNDVTHHWAILSDGAPHPGADDLQNTLSHEVGHLVGLGHTTDVAAVMYPSTHPGDLSKRTLSPDDVAGLTALYADAPTAAEQGAGCSTGVGPAPLLGLLLVLLALRRQSSRSSSVSPAERA
ncbi:MAG: matrixin family metalloprotease [Deltaproteobacteria bacterium]